MSAQAEYIKAIEHGLGLAGAHAMWPLGKDVEVGAFGTLDGDRTFTARGHLQDFERVELDPADEKPGGLTFGEGHGVDVQVSAGAQTGAPVGPLATVNLSAMLTFHDSEQVALRAAGVRFVHVRDEQTFAESIKRACADGHVHIGQCFVVETTTAESGAAAVSADKGATLQLSGTGSVAPGAALSLASLTAGIQISSFARLAFEVSMGSGFVIAVRLLQLVERGIIHRRPEVVDRVAAASEEPDFVLEFDAAAVAQEA